MRIPEHICQEQNTMGMVRRVIRILESAGEDVEREKAEFLAIFGIPYDHRTRVKVRKVHNPRIRSLEQFRRFESEGVIPKGLEKRLRDAEVELRDETAKRVRMHPDWTLSEDEETLIYYIAEVCRMFNIDNEFYRSELVDSLYEMEELL